MRRLAAQTAALSTDGLMSQARQSGQDEFYEAVNVPVFDARAVAFETHPSTDPS